ncbi:hypothetical protein GDO86_001625, partial [Hymenochirus boettgeri]
MNVYNFISGTIGQYSVEQRDHQHVLEGDPSQINCSYTGTEYSMQWYQQFPGQPLQAVAVLHRSGYIKEKQFTMFLDTNSKFTYLYLNVTRMQDSARYYCAM